jgi:hypothetical protein
MDSIHAVKNLLEAGFDNNSIINILISVRRKTAAVFDSYDAKVKAEALLAWVDENWHQLGEDIHAKKTS